TSNHGTSPSFIFIDQSTYTCANPGSNCSTFSSITPSFFLLLLWSSSNRVNHILCISPGHHVRFFRLVYPGFLFSLSLLFFECYARPLGSFHAIAFPTVIHTLQFHRLRNCIFFSAHIVVTCSNNSQ